MGWIGQKGGPKVEEEKNVATAERNCSEQTDYLEQARKLADSYRLLIHRRDLLRQQYEDSKSWFYTKEEIVYKLSQGAHEEPSMCRPADCRIRWSVPSSTAIRYWRL